MSNMNAYTRITKGETITPEYNKNGNMLFDGNHRYNYNYDNKIIQVDNGTTATYSYDALGRRIKKVTATETYLFYYAGQHVIEEHNEEGQIKAEYIFGQNLDEIICMVRNGESYYYHTDILGSVHVISNSKGKIAEKYQYDAFGKPAVYDENNSLLAQSKINNFCLFSGRQWNNETQLYYYRTRYYSAEIGRFLQSDLIGLWDDINLYRYCVNNSINNSDPFGLSKSPICMDDIELLYNVGIGNIDLSNLSPEELKDLAKRLENLNKGVEFGKQIAWGTLDVGLTMASGGTGRIAMMIGKGLKVKEGVEKFQEGWAKGILIKESIEKAGKGNYLEAFQDLALEIGAEKVIPKNMRNKLDDISSNISKYAKKKIQKLDISINKQSRNFIQENLNLNVSEAAKFRDAIFDKGKSSINKYIEDKAKESKKQLFNIGAVDFLNRAQNAF